jgi:thioredoxin reductase
VTVDAPIVTAPDVEVIVVGAGPAGLSAALVLGRACRRVLVFDHGRPRNACAQAVNGYLTRDGIPPLEFLRLGREELKRYDTVTLEEAEVVDTSCRDDGSAFEVLLRDGRRFSARKLLIATGVTDNVPEIPGLRDFYGRGVFHCPYCDGWEQRGRRLVVYGRGARGHGLAMELLGWSSHVTLCTDGAADLDAERRAQLDRNGIVVHESRVSRVEAGDGRIAAVVLDSGASIACDALFFTTGQHQAATFASSLGCRFNEKGTVHTGRHESTDVPGLYVAGDASRDVQWVIIAAAEGAEAAFAMTQDLIKAGWK